MSVHGDSFHSILVLPLLGANAFPVTAPAIVGVVRDRGDRAGREHGAVGTVARDRRECYGRPPPRCRPRRVGSQPPRSRAVRAARCLRHCGPGLRRRRPRHPRTRTRSRPRSRKRSRCCRHRPARTRTRTWTSANVGTGTSSIPIPTPRLGCRRRPRYPIGSSKSFTFTRL
jgi:hypothetical protein